MGKLIYNVEELGEVAEDMKKRINRAVVASAIKIRDNIRQAFINKASSLYRHHSGDISNLAEGIMIGKDYNKENHSLTSIFFNQENKDNFLIYLIEDKCYKKSSCNHGNLSFVALNEVTKEVVYESKYW